MKTAELFRVACFLGARIGGYPEDFCKASASFGNALGTAYQIFDDYADLFGMEQTMGKTLQTDLGKGKFTLPLILLLEVLSQEEGDFLLQKLNQPGTQQVEFIERLMEQHGIKSMVMTHFEQQLELAAAALDPYQHQPAGSRLQLLLDFVSAQMLLLT
jgi:octaprenyl-diphosphate synthase